MVNPLGSMALRLNQLREKICGTSRGSMSRFARMVGVPYSTMRRWCEGTAEPQADQLRLFVPLGVSLSWLVDGVGEMLQQCRRAGDGMVPHSECIPVPIVGPGAIGPLGLVTRGDEEVCMVPEGMVGDDVIVSALAAVRVARGAVRDVADGGMVVVDTTKTDADAIVGRVVLLEVEGAYVVRRLHRDEGGACWGVAENGDAVLPVDEQHHLCGTVIGTYMSL